MIEGSIYPITSGERDAIYCRRECCAVFGGSGGFELGIDNDSNKKISSYCKANGNSFKLTAAKESEFPSINGGEKYFQL